MHHTSPAPASRAPSQRERPFDLGELFFSTTDPKGRILSGNEVFLRVAGYTPEEVLGQPHNLIRHPDMPRIVFRTLWEHLQAGQPIAAYVKNKAKDGGYYWVVATARPVDGGFLSIRSKPCSPFFDVVQGLYRELLRVEHQAEGDGKGRTAAMDASQQVLVNALAGLGYDSYDAFMHDMLATELRCRDEQLEARGRSGTDPMLHALARIDPVLAHIHETGSGLSTYLDEVFSRVAGFRDIYVELTSRSEGLLDLADDVALLSLNAIVASGRLEVRAPTLEVVAAAMRSTCGRIADDVRRLFDQIGPVVERLANLSFGIGLAKLQWEILRFFLSELAAQESAMEWADEPEVAASAGDARDNVALLAHGLLNDVTGVRGDLETVEALLHKIGDRVTLLHQSLRELVAVELNGRVQAARVGSPAAFVTLFEQVRSSGDTAKDLASGIDTLLEGQHGGDLINDRQTRRAVERFGDGVAALVAAGHRPTVASLASGRVVAPAFA